MSKSCQPMRMSMRFQRLIKGGIKPGLIMAMVFYCFISFIVLLISFLAYFTLVHRTYVEKIGSTLLNTACRAAETEHCGPSP